MLTGLKNIFQIYANDLKNLLTNWVAIVIVSGLVILPPLYAWVNIEASWDPYGKTEGIKVAVVNEDRGATFHDKIINLGADTVTALKSNHNLGWKFYGDKEEAMADLTKGKVYAFIEMPSDFSYNLTTIFQEGHVKPVIQYYENEKINAIAPKITTAGASAVQQQINSSISNEVSKIIFTYMGDMGVALDKNSLKIESYKDLILKLDALAPEIKTTMNDLVNSEGRINNAHEKINKEIPVVNEILDNSLKMNQDLGKVLETSKNNMEALDKNINEKVTQMETVLNNSIVNVNDIGKLTEDTANELLQSIDYLTKDINDATQNVISYKIFLHNLDFSSTTDTLNTSEQLANGLISQLDNASLELRTIKNTIQSGDIAKIQDAVNRLNGINAKINTANHDISENYNNTVLPTINLFLNGFITLNNFLNDSFDKTGQVNMATLDQMGLLLSKEKEMLQKTANSKIAVISDLSKKQLLTVHNMESNVKKLKEESNQNNAKNSMNELNQAINSFQSNATQFGNSLGGFVNGLGALGNTISTLTQDAVPKVQNLPNKIDQALLNITLLQSMLQDYIHIVQNIKKIDTAYALQDAENKIQKNIDTLKAYKNHLMALKSKIIQGNADIQSTLKNINNDNVKLLSGMKKIKEDYNDTVSPYLKTNLERLVVVNHDISSLMLDTKDGLNHFKDFLEVGNENTNFLFENVNEVNKKLPEIQDSIHKLAQLLNQFDTKYDLNAIISMLTQSSNIEGDTAKFVDLKKNAVFPLPNYGSAMSPFFTTLSLWVGSLFLVSLLSIKVKGEYKTYEKFLGKYLFFGTVAVLQGLMVTLGDVYVLKTFVSNIPLFVLVGVLESIVFSMMVYTLASLFDNVGKAIGVVLLVLQLSASGGTFPIEVTSPFFKSVNPFLPFTYAIGAMRETVGGIVWDNFYRNVAILACYFMVSCFIALKLKEPINKLGAGFAKKFQESHLSEH